MNLKKIVAAGIAAVCAVSMAACGGSGSGSSKVTDIQYKDIKLGQTGKDIKANLKLFSHRADMLKNDYPGTTWKQYIADICNVKLLEVSTFSDSATSLGAAAAAGVGIGLFKSLPEAVRHISLSGSVEPSENAEELYGLTKKRYAMLYPALKEAFHTRAYKTETKGGAEEAPPFCRRLGPAASPQETGEGKPFRNFKLLLFSY